MSSGSQEKHAGGRAELTRELTRELRLFNGLSASFFRAVAARSEMTVTDIQVIDMLDSTGPTTAGQLAELTGLTTGAITGMINRLEEAGLVRRERDPNDGRRVIVQLVPGKDEMHKVGPIFAAMGTAWDEMTAHYDDAQVAFLLEFLKSSNALSRREIVRLREAPEGAGEIFAAPLGKLESARLVVSAGVTRLTLRANNAMSELYQARFEGPLPDMKVREGVVTIRYPRRLLGLVREQRTAEVTLSAAVSWHIVIQGGASEIVAELGDLNLAGLEIKGGLSTIYLDLPRPSAVVPLQIRGGASTVSVRRPAGVPARVHLKGWVSAFVFDKQTYSDVGNDVRLQSPGLEPTTPYYDIEVASSASMVTITTASPLLDSY